MPSHLRRSHSGSVLPKPKRNIPDAFWDGIFEICSPMGVTSQVNEPDKIDTTTVSMEVLFPLEETFPPEIRHTFAQGKLSLSSKCTCCPRTL
jgi:hypothetical protein